jgi:hypothetical protein
MTDDPMFFPRLRRHAKFMFIALAVIFVLGFIIVAVARAGVQGAHKQKLNRDDIYYEIVNDGDDHGNYVETYHVPNDRGGKVYCVVYSDKIGDGGGAGIDCDWAHAQ